MIDHTSWHCVGAPATLCVPSADHATQPFLFDLGVAHKLTYNTISSLKVTFIPHFRVEGSNGWLTLDGHHGYVRP